MSGFTTQEMVTQLGLRLEDADTQMFSDPVKLDGLNFAQLEITNFLNRSLLKELEVRDYSLACALQDSGNDYEGSVLFSALTYQPLANGIQAVKINGGARAFMIEPEEVMKMNNVRYQGTNKRPIAYVSGKRIYLAAGDDTQNIDVEYLREPTPMQTVFTIASLTTAVADITAPDLDARHCVADFGTPSPAWTVAEFVGQTGYNKSKESNFIVYANGVDALSLIYYDTDIAYEVGDECYFTSADANVTNLANASCELNPSLHGIVVDLAEANIWPQDNKSDRADRAFNKAMTAIVAMHEKYGLEGPKGIGTRTNRER